MSNSRSVSAGATCVSASAVLLGAGIWFPFDGPEAMRWAALGLAAVLMLVWSAALVVRRIQTERVLLLGSSPFATKICEAVDMAGDSRFKIVGLVNEAPTAERVSGYAPWVGTPDQLDAIVERIQPARIVLTLPDRRGGRLPERALLQARLRGVRVEEGIAFYERVAGKLAIESLPATSLILSGGFRRLELKREGFWWRSSRIVECIIASLALIALLPLLAVCALLIKLDSRGSMFFIQPRVGCGGRPFGLIKFRTMHEATGERTEWFRDNADRVTRVGEWLRRFRMDELPQLINVLRGEMSFVGPRPHPVTNYQKFLKEIPYYHLREMVRPGITGWAQVKYGYANNLEEETEKMRFDIYYIKHRSLWLDARIAVETVLLLMFDRRSHQTAKSTKPSNSWPPGRVAPLG